jgi:hypothetical protein
MRVCSVSPKGRHRLAVKEESHGAHEAVGNNYDLINAFLSAAFKSEGHYKSCSDQCPQRTQFLSPTDAHPQTIDKPVGRTPILGDSTQLRP